MRSYVLLLLIFFGIYISACSKKSVPVSHEVKYIASADTFNFGVTYTDVDKNSITIDSVNNGWTEVFTISNQSGFPAKLSIHSDSGHHVVANIYVDQIKVTTSQSDSGTISASYIIP